MKRFIASLALVGCGLGDREPPPFRPYAATTPRLDLADTIMQFNGTPGHGTYGYERNGGGYGIYRVFNNFGVTSKDEKFALDLGQGDVPDLKMRVQITLASTTGNPRGDVTVYGKQYGANGAIVDMPPETLSFVTSATKTTTTYYDEVTEVATSGLGTDATLTVRYWDGHEQEMQYGVGILGMTDEASCEDDYRVHINGQIASPVWSAINSTCTATLMPYGASRGLYFPVDPDFNGTDTYHHFVSGTYMDLLPTAHPWQDWLKHAGAARLFFDVDDHASNETRLRPIVVTLERVSDEAIVDTARVMMTIATNPQGNPSLVSVTPATQIPGAIGQLSPSGLGNLSRTHQDTLPYPIEPAGTQPRLSQSAIGVTHHATTSPITVDLTDLTADDIAYWTQPNPTSGGPEFAGYLAYKDIKQTTRDDFAAFKAAIKNCGGDAKCEAGIKATFCVQHAPDDSDYRLSVLQLDTYFDPSRPLDALVVGDIVNLSLTFATNAILSMFSLASIQGWLYASIDPSNIQIEYTSGPLTCFLFKPGARKLSEFPSGSADRNHWLECSALSFAAPTGTLAAPIGFGIAGSGEDLSTPYQNQTPTVSLPVVTAGSGNGICSESWLSPTVQTEIIGWKHDVETTIGAELVTSPGEDEALKRLVSPFELGIKSVTAPPPGTPAYDVHPIQTYDVTANIARTSKDTGGLSANPTDGLYLPYVTQAAALTGVDAWPTWLCPSTYMPGAIGVPAQSCGAVTDAHLARLGGGLDPKGAPYDVSLDYTTAYLSQALWAQAARNDRLGSPTQPARLVLSGTALVDRARAFGYQDAADALAAAGSTLGVRYHQEAAPYTVIDDGVARSKLIYSTPNVVLEVVSVGAAGHETVVAKVIVDVIDFDHTLLFRTDGTPALDARWGNVSIQSVTTTYLPGCYASANATPSCDTHLLEVVGSFWIPQVEPALLDMIEQMPALQLFDSAAESHKPRWVKNPRMFLGYQGVTLVGDLCVPGTTGCGS